MTTGTETYRYGRLCIRYFDVDVPAIAIGRAIYFPVRALCKAIGMASQMQLKRIQEDPDLEGAWRTLPIPTIKGLRDAVCLNKQRVAKWLGKLDPSRCPITTRGSLERFQEELFAAADRFLFGSVDDLAYDEGTKTDRALGGTLHIGECPRCGLKLILAIDDKGPHVHAAEEIES